MNDRKLGLAAPRGRLAVFAGPAVALLVGFSETAAGLESFCPHGSSPDPAVLWCDDFDDSTPLSQKYFEYDNNGGDFVPVAGSGRNGSAGMRVHWQPGETGAGNFKRTFGRNPVSSQSHSNQDFREIYWRLYVRMEGTWSGGPDKLSRATSFATSGWAQSMIAHVWSSGDVLSIDPASGTDANGNLQTTTYNDFAHLRWLGLTKGTTPLFSATGTNRWYCIEAHVKLNTPGASDGVFDLWFDDKPEAQRAGMNWVGSYAAYGINAVFIENWWNAGAPADRYRYFDDFVISTKRIGCGSGVIGVPGKPMLAP